MTQAISHQQAQVYIHAAADRALRPDEKIPLDAHLLDCADCRTYAGDFASLEAALRKTLAHRWKVAPRPLSLDRALGWQKAILFQHLPPIAAIPVLVLFLAAFAMILTRSTLFDGSQPTSPSTMIVATSVPTPTVEMAHTDAAVTVAMPSSTTMMPITTKECDWVRYEIQPDDTLSSIAEKFGVSPQAIRDVNPIHEGFPVDPYVINIPLCATPDTLTYTPTYTPTSYNP